MTNVARTNRNLGINRTTLLRLLHTLEAKRFIAPRGPEGAGWQIGTGLIGLAARAFAAEDLTQVAIPMRGAGQPGGAGFTRHRAAESLVPGAAFPLRDRNWAPFRPHAARREAGAVARCEGRSACPERRCPHRDVLLSRGQNEGDWLRCNDHGVEAAPIGTALAAPGQPGSPLEGKQPVRSWSAVEFADSIFVRFGDSLHREAPPFLPSEPLAGR